MQNYTDMSAATAVAEEVRVLLLPVCACVTGLSPAL